MKLKRLIFALLLAISPLLAMESKLSLSEQNASANIDTKKALEKKGVIFTKIINVNKNRVIIEKNTSIKLGQSALIVRNREADIKNIIVNLAVVTNISDTITLSLSDMENLKQKFLPTPRLTPKIGDEVIFNLMYDRGFLIAPNQEIYSKAKELINGQNIQLESPDLLYGIILQGGKFDPNFKLVNKACDVYGVGLLLIAVDGRLYKLDCKSFKTIEIRDLDFSSTTSFAPFFTHFAESDKRIKPVFASKYSENYNAFYKKFIEVGNSLKPKWSIEKTIKIKVPKIAKTKN